MQVGCRRGNALLLVLGVTATLIIVLSLLAVSLGGNRLVQAVEKELIAAQYLAEAGINLMLDRLRQNGTAATAISNLPLGDGLIEFAQYDSSNRQIKARARVGRARKALIAQVSSWNYLSDFTCALSGDLYVPAGAVIDGNIWAENIIVASNGTVRNARYLVAGRDFINNGTANLIPGGQVIVSNDLVNRGRLENAGLAAAANQLFNTSSGLISFSPGGCWYAATFTNQGSVCGGGAFGPGMLSVMPPEVSLWQGRRGIVTPLDWLTGYEGYPALPWQQEGSDLRLDLNTLSVGSYYGIPNVPLRVSGTYRGRLLLAVNGDVLVNGPVLPRDPARDVLVLLVGGKLTVNTGGTGTAFYGLVAAHQVEVAGGQMVKGTVLADDLLLGTGASVLPATQLWDNLTGFASTPSTWKGWRVVRWQEVYPVF